MGYRTMSDGWSEPPELVAGRRDARRAAAFLSVVEGWNLFKADELATILAAYVASMPKSEAKETDDDDAG